MGKDLRKKEPEMISNYFESLGIPIIGRISSPARLTLVARGREWSLFLGRRPEEAIIPAVMRSRKGEDDGIIYVTLVY